MSKLLTGSICLTDINKEAINIGKNGKKYINVNVWINDEKDRFGNDASIQQYIDKENKIYIGNVKYFEKDSEKVPNATPENKKDEAGDDDMPW